VGTQQDCSWVCLVRQHHLLVLGRATRAQAASVHQIKCFVLERRSRIQAVSMHGDRNAHSRTAMHLSSREWSQAAPKLPNTISDDPEADNQSACGRRDHYLVAAKTILH
jgi:hypothetical protein